MITDNSQQDISGLKNQIFTLLVALIVVSGTMTTMLYQQASQANKDISQADQLRVMLGQNEQNLNAFAVKLLQYSDKHPDIKPLLTKYGVTPANFIPGAAAAAPKK